MMMLVYRIASRRRAIEFAGDEHQHGADHRHRQDEDQSPGRTARATARARARGAEGEAAAENAPVDRPPLDGLGLISNTPGTEIAGTTSASRNTVSRGRKPREPAGQPGDGENAEPKRQAAEHLHHAELGANLVLGPRTARGVDAGHDLGRHRVGHDVLDHRADHDQHRAEDVELAGPRTASQPPAAPASVSKPHDSAWRRSGYRRGAASRRSARCRPARRTPS